MGDHPSKDLEFCLQALAVHWAIIVLKKARTESNGPGSIHKIIIPVKLVLP